MASILPRIPKNIRLSTIANTSEIIIREKTRASSEQNKTVALRIEQMTRKAYVNNAPDMRNAQMNDALVKALGPQLARIALKKRARYKSTSLEPQPPFAQLVEKTYKEEITRTQIVRHKLNKNSTPSSSFNNLSFDIDHLTVDDIHAMEHNIAYEINVVRQKYSNDPNFKEKLLALKF